MSKDRVICLSTDITERYLKTLLEIYYERETFNFLEEFRSVDATETGTSLVS